MPTKNQAKTAIDNAVTSIKSDIDTILPVGVNIKDGGIAFSPIKYTIILDAGGSLQTAITWMDTIKTNLTAAGRGSHNTNRADRRSDDVTNKFIMISEAKLTVIITNF